MRPANGEFDDYGTRVMDYTRFLDVLPLWLLFPLTIALVIGAVELGYRIGRKRRAEAGGEPEKDGRSARLSPPRWASWRSCSASPSRSPPPGSTTAAGS